MNCEIHDAGGAAVVTLSGDVDLESSPRVRSALLECVRSKSGVVVDMSAVDSTTGARWVSADSSVASVKVASLPNRGSGTGVT